jgi:uncharacterized protein (DUF1697 family)
MPTYIALLRGINLGSRNKIAMAELRELLDSLGHGEVRTHILSGNAIFTSSIRSAAKLATEIERAIDRHFHLDVRVLIRTGDELAAVVKANPLREATGDPSHYYAVFLDADPKREVIDAIDPAAFEPEQFRFGDRVVYAWYRNGMQRSKLAGALSDRRLGVTTTARNWNTVTKLLSLASD